jgi:RNA polymerase primary sigma factor
MSSRLKRQLIQRIGRVLRKKKDNCLARILIIYVHGTPEDSNGGAHEDIREIIMDAACDYKVFNDGHDTKGLIAYLNNWEQRPNPIKPYS